MKLHLPRSYFEKQTSPTKSADLLALLKRAYGTPATRHRRSSAILVVPFPRSGWSPGACAGDHHAAGPINRMNISRDLFSGYPKIAFQNCEHAIAGGVAYRGAQAQQFRIGAVDQHHVIVWRGETLGQ